MREKPLNLDGIEIRQLRDRCNSEGVFDCPLRKSFLLSIA